MAKTGCEYFLPFLPALFRGTGKHDLHTEIYKGHNSVKTAGGIMLLALSTLSDDALYLYQVL